jgi:hypothetical protein
VDTTNQEKQKWFYELPEINGNYYFTPLRSNEQFIVRISSISIQNCDYFLVESIGKDNILGLMLFFSIFTGKFPGEETLGYSNGTVPFLVNFRFGLEYLIFKGNLKLVSKSVRFVPAVLVHQSRKMDVWYFL